MQLSSLSALALVRFVFNAVPPNPARSPARVEAAGALLRLYMVASAESAGLAESAAVSASSSASSMESMRWRSALREGRRVPKSIAVEDLTWSQSGGPRRMSCCSSDRHVNAVLR